MCLEFKPRAEKDLADLPKADQSRILQKIELLQNGLTGDIKRLTNFTPEYRLRVGDYRILFEILEGSIIVYRILHRRDAYR
ncbi:MAG: type II toxin-antitoxin system RelE/ParE family toxin [Candidatus Competibacter sp.]|nr:type II toxin-antitoxin system RelE/ParE family toxin [Candidatus Competibacter sp.]